MTFRNTLVAALAIGLSTAAQAHVVWIERDGAGPARIYLGEPAEILPARGDPEFEKLTAPRLLSAPGVRQIRKAGYIEAAVPAGDVRAWDDNVFAPWGDPGKREGVVYYARAGRSDPRGAMPLEIAPASAGADRFTLLRDGTPVANQAITIVSPDKWSKTLRTDAQGGIIVPIRERGRYILTTAIADKGTHATPGGSVDILHRITTTTFVAR